MELNTSSKLNKFEIQIIQLNGSKVRLMKLILVKFKGCNLHFNLKKKIINELELILNIDRL